MTNTVLAPASATAQVITCPVDDCDWAHLEPVLDVPPAALNDMFGVGVYEAVARAQRLDRIETVLAKHYAGHQPQDYLRTITRLRAELAQHATGEQPDAQR